MKIFYITLLIWNIAVMLIYGTDKFFARKNKRRIKESTLILISFLLGGAGAVFGMVIFNHKTSKMKFRMSVPLSIIFGSAAVIWLSYLF